MSSTNGGPITQPTVHFCLNPATTMTTDLLTDLRAYAQAGFKATELWLAKVDRFVESGHTWREVGGILRDHGLAAPAACAQGNLLIPSPEERQKSFDALARRLEGMATIGCPVLIVPSEALPQPLPRPVDSLYAQAVDNFAEACDLAHPYGVSLALEFIKGPRLVATPLTAQEIATRSQRDNAGVLFDTFHFYAGYGKMGDLAHLNASQILFVHVNDAPASVPREALTDKDRVLPGTGSFPLAEIIQSIEDLGYAGYYSLELFNDDLWAEDPFRVAQQAYRSMVDLLGEDGATV